MLNLIGRTMKNRTLILLLFFVLVGGTTLYYLLHADDRKSTILYEERSFAIEDTAAIYKIFLADRFDHQTTLERKGTHWTYNQKYKANANAVENLLDAIKRVKMQFKPPNAAVNNLVKSLATEGIKVELYDRQNNLMKAYYIGGSTPDERGTYIMIEGANQPYVASIPAWTGNIRFRYNLTGDDWRDKTVFGLSAEQIKAISINYPLQRNQSFKLVRNKQQYELSPFYDLTPRKPQAPSQGKIQAFLYLFDHLLAESFINGQAKRDSILQQIPFCEIRLEQTDGTIKEVALHPRYFQTGLDEKTGGGTVETIVERYYANVDNEDFMLVQNEVFKKIFWSYDFFFD